jgi:drug/metabolite transporter (DMT)-like permease
MANTERNAARLLALAAAVLFSTGGAGIKVESFSGAQVSGVRSGIAPWPSPLVAPADSMDLEDCVAAAVYAATLSLFVGATKLTTAANAIFLQSTAPLYVLLLAPLVLQRTCSPAGDGLPRRCSGRNGLLLYRTSSADLHSIESGSWQLARHRVGIGVGAHAADAQKHWPRRSPQRHTLAAVVAGNAIACVAALPFALPMPRGTTAEWITWCISASSRSDWPTVCLSSAIRRLPALEVSLLLLLEPVLNPIWTRIIRGEDPGKWTILGGAAIVGATMIKLSRRCSPPGGQSSIALLPRDATCSLTQQPVLELPPRLDPPQRAPWR